MTMKAYLKQNTGRQHFSLVCHANWELLCQDSRRKKVDSFPNRSSPWYGIQIRDDLIDYQLDVRVSGKPQLQDLQNGIYTAPLLLA